MVPGGQGGPLSSQRRPTITGYIAGICGADVSPDMIEDMVTRALTRKRLRIAHMGTEGLKMMAEEMEREYMRPGHMACPGCGEATTMRLVLKVLGEKTVVVILPSCVGVISATYPNSTFSVPCFHSAFEIAAPTASGISNALKIQGREDVTTLAFAGDGGTFDIGLQSLSGAADRNDNFIYVCLDNEAYMNTGIQSSSSTPQNAWTMTTPGGRRGRKKKFMQIIAAHRIPYAATASMGHPRGPHG